MATTGTTEPIELEEDEDPAGIPPDSIELTGPPPVPADEDEERDIDAQEEAPVV